MPHSPLAVTLTDDERARTRLADPYSIRRTCVA